MILYSIQPGDTVYKIAAQFNVPMEQLLSVNPGLYPYNLLVGQQINIPLESGDPPAPPQAPAQPTIPAVTLQNTLRRLWTDHLEWTRMAINSIASGSPDFNAISARLARNVSDMEAFLRQFYGNDSAAQFGRLFQQHVNLIAQMAREMKAGNTQAEQNTEQQAYANADAIATLLSSLNPYFNRDVLRRDLYRHIGLMKALIAVRLSRNFAQEIALYDQAKDNVTGIADLWASGLARQFPATIR